MAEQLALRDGSSAASTDKHFNEWTTGWVLLTTAFSIGGNGPHIRPGAAHPNKHHRLAGGAAKQKWNFPPLRLPLGGTIGGHLGFRRPPNHSVWSFQWLGWIFKSGWNFQQQGWSHLFPFKKFNVNSTVLVLRLLLVIQLEADGRKKPAPSGLTASRTDMMDTPHSQLTD